MGEVGVHCVEEAMHYLSVEDFLTLVKILKEKSVEVEEAGGIVSSPILSN